MPRTTKHEIKFTIDGVPDADTHPLMPLPPSHAKVRALLESLPLGRLITSRFRIAAMTGLSISTVDVALRNPLLAGNSTPRLKANKSQAKVYGSQQTIAEYAKKLKKHQIRLHVDPRGAGEAD